jgi:hypothetical protein
MEKQNVLSDVGAKSVNTVGIATGSTAGVRIPAGVRLFSTTSRLLLWLTQTTIEWVPGGKRPGCEADYSQPSSAELKNGGARPPLLHTA